MQFRVNIPMAVELSAGELLALRERDAEATTADARARLDADSIALGFRSFAEHLGHWERVWEQIRAKGWAAEHAPGIGL